MARAPPRRPARREGVAPLGDAARHLRACAEAAARIDALTARAPTVADPAAPVPLPDDGPRAAERVTAGYPGGSPVLRGASLRLHPGERVVLLGASGAGKTTLARLLARLRDPDGGRVAIGGVDAPTRP